MSDQWAPEQSNIDTQIAIGKALRSRIPGQSPYATVRSAATQLYPGLGVNTDSNAPSSDLGAWTNDGGDSPGINGTVHVNERAIRSGPYGKIIPNSEDMQNFITGVYAHEILGHGGDTWLSRGHSDEDRTFSDGNTNGFLGHFKYEPSPQDPQKRSDDINFLNPQVNKVLSPPLFEAQQALRDAQARQEAAQRGLQTELPTQVKGQLPAPFFPTAPSPYSVVKPSY